MLSLVRVFFKGISVTSSFLLPTVSSAFLLIALRTRSAVDDDVMMLAKKKSARCTVSYYREDGVGMVEFMDGFLGSLLSRREKEESRRQLFHQEGINMQSP